jgi:solute carrier family 30 (zinc transporter), member 9
MSSHQEAGLKTVLVAVINNLLVTIAKFIGFALSGSGALFSEAIHSFADTLNQALLLLGIRRAEKAPDENFDYGYAQERFFWALISATGIFFIGAGVTLYHGIHALFAKEVAEIGWNTFVILGVSLALEGKSFHTAYMEIKAEGLTFKTAFEEGNPTTIAVLYEDSAAILGIILATISSIITYYTHNYLWDALCSIIIAVMLGSLAVVLININRKYLIEQSMPVELEEKLIETLTGMDFIADVTELRSALLTIDVYRVKCEVRIDGDAFKRLHEKSASSGQVIPIEAIPSFIGKLIDQAKATAMAAVPEVKFLKIEISA